MSLDAWIYFASVSHPHCISSIFCVLHKRRSSTRNQVTFILPEVQVLVI